MNAALQAIRAPAPVPERLDELLDAAYRYALSLTHDATEAEDLVQDAAVALLATGKSWDRPYVFATVRNRFIDRYRRRNKALFVSLDQDDNAADDVDELAWEAPDVLATGALEQALAALRVDEREAIFLSLVEGYTAEEIGTLTDRPRGTILSLLHRAKKRLRQLLGGNGLSS